MFSRLLKKLIKCLGEVNLDSAAFQPSPSSQSQFPASPSPSPSASPRPSVLAERKREGIYKLTSTSSRSSSDERNYLPTQPNTAKAASGNPPSQRGVLRTVPLGAGRKGSAPKKRLIGKLGFLGRKYGTALRCAVLCCTVQYSTVLSCWPLVDVPIVYVPQPGWAPLPSPESPFAATRSS